MCNFPCAIPGIIDRRAVRVWIVSCTIPVRYDMAIAHVLLQLSALLRIVFLSATGSFAPFTSVVVVVVGRLSVVVHLWAWGNGQEEHINTDWSCPTVEARQSHSATQVYGAPSSEMLAFAVCC